MKISARVKNRKDNHEVMLLTEDHSHTIQIPSKEGGFGSGANGGELLFLALATCYCNDIYREAKKKNIKVESVEVEAGGNFDGIGQPAANIRYQVKIKAYADEQQILDLISHTDKVAEIQNTLRAGVPVTMTGMEAESL